MKTSQLRIFCLVMLILVLSIPTSIAIANSLPPPFRDLVPVCFAKR